jgi:hypothetical protein
MRALVVAGLAWLFVFVQGAHAAHALPLTTRVRHAFISRFGTPAEPSVAHERQLRRGLAGLMATNAPARQRSFAKLAKALADPELSGRVRVGSPIATMALSATTLTALRIDRATRLRHSGLADLVALRVLLEPLLAKGGKLALEPAARAAMVGALEELAQNATANAELLARRIDRDLDRLNPRTHAAAEHALAGASRAADQLEQAASAVAALGQAAGVQNALGNYYLAGLARRAHERVQNLASQGNTGAARR